MRRSRPARRRAVALKVDLRPFRGAVVPSPAGVTCGHYSPPRRPWPWPT
jgi:hypothetical protein